MDGTTQARPLLKDRLTLIETANELGVSVSTIHRLLAKGELRSKRIGRKAFIRREVLEEWLSHDDLP